uniref:Uncharacterized protein n=1 Tax=Megaselia scalaris TaxID=36166 RepID=T1GIV6_MEGSC
MEATKLYRQKRRRFEKRKSKTGSKLLNGDLSRVTPHEEDSLSFDNTEDIPHHLWKKFKLQSDDIPAEQWMCKVKITCKIQKQKKPFSDNQNKLLAKFI